MAKRNSGRRGRPRKRRPALQTAGDAGAQDAGAQPRAPARDAPAPARRRARSASAGSGGVLDLRALGERPRPPWYPWPLSELLILVGIIGVIVGFSRGSGGIGLLLAGIGAVVIGTLEFSVREHLGGYRSHTVLLAAVPTVVVHSACALALVALGAPATASALAPLIVDVPVFSLLFKLLRERFLSARRERVLEQRR